MTCKVHRGKRSRRGEWSDHCGQILVVREKENSLVKDIKSHGYTEKAVKQCGMRYLGPHFYENWSPDRDLNDDGTCANADVNYATQFSDRNVRYWYLGMCRVIVPLQKNSCHTLI